MKKLLILLLVLSAISSAFPQELWVKNLKHQQVVISDSGALSLNPYCFAFFDDKEFVNDIKKGYTHPGFFIQPMLVYKPSSHTRVSAGLHTLYFAGADSVEKVVPVLSLEVKLMRGIEMILGTIHSKQAHFLPEPLFKPERLYTAQPETGIQFLTLTDHFVADSWTNWERYIKTGSPFQEVFTMGFAGIYKPGSFSSKSGLALHLSGFGVHNGGQIDSTNLDVTTMINLASGLSYAHPILNCKINFGIELFGFLSSDKSPNPSSKYKNGRAIYPKLFVESLSVRAELGYWSSSTFVNPRGEELFGSYSIVKPEFDSKNRKLVTAKLIYSAEVTEGFSVGGRVETYYDPGSSILDWAFTFRMVFDKNLLIR